MLRRPEEVSNVPWKNCGKDVGRGKAIGVQVLLKQEWF